MNITAPLGPTRSDARIGDRVIVRATGERFVPMHRFAKPSFFYGARQESAGQVIDRDDGGRWLLLRLSNGVERWVKAERVVPDAAKMAHSPADCGIDSKPDAPGVSDPRPFAASISGATRAGLMRGRRERSASPVRPSTA